MGYPSQTDYGYGQWEQPAKSHDSGELSEDIHRKRQQELESSTRTGAESVASADSHVTEKKEGDGKEEKKKGLLCYIAKIDNSEQSLHAI